jgi:hypothetical protein
VADAAVLGHYPDAAARASSEAVAPPVTTRSRPPSSNAAAIATRDRDALVRLAITFAQLGCPYQKARAGRIAVGPLDSTEPASIDRALLRDRMTRHGRALREQQTRAGKDEATRPRPTEIRRPAAGCAIGSYDAG